MKKIKHNIRELKVKSFIIEQNNLDKLTIKGGDLGSDGPPLTTSTNTNEFHCPPAYITDNCPASISCHPPTDEYK